MTYVGWYKTGIAGKSGSVAGLRRMQEPSFSHSRPRFDCFAGTFKPSRRQMRSTRLWLTHQPSARSNAVIRR